MGLLRNPLLLAGTHLLLEAASQRNLDLRRVNHPIPDNGTLAVGEYDEIIESIRRGTERGGVYLHCGEGIGRTGTVVGCQGNCQLPTGTR